MKKIKLIVCTLLVCISFAGVAEAKSRGGSFKSGFASQKRNAAKPESTHKSPAEHSKKTEFGSFGAANTKSQQAAETIPQSKMSKDLTDNAAQANALKTVGTRNKVNENPTASDSGWFRSGNQNTAPQAPANGANVQANSQRFERRNNSQQNNGGQSNGLLYGLMGFMLGNSLAHHATAANSQPVNQNQANGNDNDSENNQGIQQSANGESNSINTEGVVTQRTQDVSAEETESIFMKIVRLLLWLAIISGIIWAVRSVLGFRHRNVKKSTHYSLGS